jgi:hypothetical protein
MVAASGLCSQESSLGTVADGSEVRNVAVCCSISSAKMGQGRGALPEASGLEVELRSNVLNIGLESSRCL